MATTLQSPAPQAADDDALMRRVAAQGERFLAGLRAVAAEHPGVIAEVREG